MKVQVGEWELVVDIAQTQHFYKSLPHNNEDMFGLNYIEVCSFYEPEISHFFQQLGIDLLKPTNLHSLPLEGNSIMYSGCYHIVGEQLQGEFEEWDVFVEPFCFALTEGQYIKPQQLLNASVEISFEVVLP